jgi:hypothetical protein
VARDESSASKYKGSEPVEKKSTTIVFQEADRKTVVTATTDKYAHVPAQHSPITIKVADPIFVNPNSYLSLAEILRKIGQECGISRYGGNLREWTVVCCDGLPYGLLMRLIEDQRICLTCNESFFGDALQKHLKTAHLDCNSTRYCAEFDWVVLKVIFLNTAEPSIFMSLLFSKLCSPR